MSQMCRALLRQISLDQSTPNLTISTVPAVFKIYVALRPPPFTLTHDVYHFSFLPVFPSHLHYVNHSPNFGAANGAVDAPVAYLGIQRDK